MSGQTIPDVNIFEASPKEPVKATSIFAGKKTVLFGVPGAFTPTCSETHLPGYIEKFDEFKAAGADQIAVIAQNDAFVMQAWGKQTGGRDKGIRFLSDVQLELSKPLDLAVDLPPLGGMKTKRFSMIIDDNKIVGLYVEPDNTGLSISAAEPTLEKLKAL